MKPLIRQAADEIRYDWPEVGITLAFDRLHETDSGAVRGMLTVDNMVTNGSPGHIFWSAVTLTTTSDRKALTQKLDKVAPQPDRASWEADVDRTFQDCYQRHTAVPPPSELSGAAQETELNMAMLIDPLLPEGLVTLLLADQGTTKSYFMLYLATCIALDRETVFGAPSRCGPVVFFDWEVDERTANRRLSWICRGLQCEPPRHLYYVDMSTKGRLFDRIRDMRHMVERIQPVLVIIDSLTFATGADLNSAEYAAPTMAAVGSLGENVTKLASTHPNKASRNAATDDVSVIGSGLFEFRARMIWHMQRERGARAARFGVSLTSRKPFDGPPQKPLAYMMDFDNVQHAARFSSARLGDLPSLEANSMSQAERIRRALARGGRLDTNQLAEVTGLAREQVKNTCNDMPDVFPIVAGGGRGKPTVWALQA